MKKILAFLIFNLLIINPSQADNISDFQIEEMSLGDSVLNFMNEKDFLKFTLLNNFKNKEYSARETRNKKFLKVYDSLQVNYISNDKQYKIYGLSGLLNFKDNYQECMSKQKEVLEELQALFPQAKKIGPLKKNFQDKLTKGYWEGHAYQLPNGDLAVIACYNYEKKKMIDHLRISIRYKAYNDFLLNRAYK